ncbi:hypothetical protein DM455_04250 [Legionella pneumophila]|nr:hypothetical protein DM456_04830 [Legionella pneumophila]PYB64690.1 hypothetical protein DM455_04250 [Legionella pneumophila]RYX20322.1 hypothetical protein D7267_15370 [Legionella pneumophila]RYX24367.1 hypothetical protein D8B28_14555 [Legionella pneumophila]RYX47025.1 hypothetical protein D7274_15555 [Legionella pneumophila]
MGLLPKRSKTIVPVVFLVGKNKCLMVLSAAINRVYSPPIKPDLKFWPRLCLMRSWVTIKNNYLS